LSRIAPTHEKVLAVARTYFALKQELHNQIAIADPGVQAVLLDVAGRIAMGTDTRDLGIMGAQPRPSLTQRVADEFGGAPCDDCGALSGQPHDMSVEH
jgi:hypothetical protein